MKEAIIVVCVVLVVWFALMVTAGCQSAGMPRDEEHEALMRFWRLMEEAQSAAPDLSGYGDFGEQ